MAVSLNQYQTKANVLLKKRESLEKEEADLDAKIASYSTLLKGQQMILKSANNFLTEYGTTVMSNKTISEDLQKALKNTEKETESYVQCKSRYSISCQ